MASHGSPASGSSSTPQSKRPKDSDFYQQRLKAWQPILTPKWVIVAFLCIGVPFVIIGFVLKAASDGVVEHAPISVAGVAVMSVLLGIVQARAQYDGSGANVQGCELSNSNPARVCTISVTAPAAMRPPVYVYYELENFYQNHRRYVKSKSDQQLQGQEDINAGIVDCDPLRSAGNRTLYPCGLIANSYFNDSFSLAAAPAGVSMSETGISWESDRTRKFKAPSTAWVNANRGAMKYIDESYPGVASVTNEHFIVWMRVAALPTFRKLYGIINQEVPAGSALTFNVSANFRVDTFSGKKAIVVSTVSAIGGKNPFLGIAYLVVGFLCIALALVFGIKQFFGGRRLGDTSFLVWQTRR